MVENFIQMLIQKGILDELRKEEYIYSLTTLLEKLIAYSILFGISIAVGKMAEGMIFTISFILLRETTGGFHAESFMGCICGSICTLLIAIKVLAPLAEKYLLAAGIILLLSIVCILHWAPVNHPNLSLTAEEIKHHKVWARVMLCMELVAVCLGYWLQVSWQQYIITAVIMCAVFILIAKITRQEVKENEERKSYS